MEITTKITKKEAVISIKLKKKKSKLESSILIDFAKAREELLKKHPELNLSRKPIHVHHIDNLSDKLEGEWIFPLVVEEKAVEEKPAEEPVKKEEKKVSKKTKNILNFKPKSDTVVETTEPEADQAKGVQEPTE